MDRPRLRYTRTSDDVSIAYTITGAGPPLLLTVDPSVSNVERNWSLQTFREHFDRIGERFTLCHFDWRNTGSSTRGVPFGREEWGRDLEAVAQLFDEPISIIDAEHHGVTFAFAAKHPECVRRLITWNISRSRETYWPSRLAEAQLVRLDPGWTRLIARRLGGQVAESVHRDMEESMATAAEADYRAAVIELVAPDPTEDLKHISVPTLVMQRRGLGAEVGADLAAHIPGAELRIVEGNSHWFGDVEDPLPIMLDYFAQDRVSEPSEGTAALSPRELDVLRLLAAGKTNAQIADVLTLSNATVATHVGHILQKTGSANRAEATAYAVRNGLA